MEGGRPAGYFFAGSFLSCLGFFTSRLRTLFPLPTVGLLCGERLGGWTDLTFGLGDDDGLGRRLGLAILRRKFGGGIETQDEDAGVGEPSGGGEGAEFVQPDLCP